MKYIIIDLEMNPLSKEFREERRICRNEIIQIGAVALDENYQEVGAFKTFVKPQFNEIITRKIEKLTGITTAVVQDAPVFDGDFVNQAPVPLHQRPLRVLIGWIVLKSGNEFFHGLARLLVLIRNARSFPKWPYYTGFIFVLACWRVNAVTTNGGTLL